MAALMRRKGSRYWIVRYVEQDGTPRQRSTRTTDRRVADRIRRQIESDLANRMAGLVDDQAAAFEEASREPLSQHVDVYLNSCKASGQASRRIQGKQLHLKYAMESMRATRLAHITSDAMRGWMDELRGHSLSATTVNEYRCSLNAFLNWCVKDGRLRSNPIKHVSPLSTRGLKSRHRRILEDDEINRLIQVAIEQDHMNSGRGWSSRRAVYLTALFTGLRRQELKSICWRDVDLEQGVMTIREDVGKANRQDEIPLHGSVVEVLAELPRGAASDRIFKNVPTIHTFKRDCQRANIPLKDEAGRTVDFHSLRATFCTRLIKAGVPAAHVQRLMRHADIKTTNSHYTDLRIHDLDGAVNTLDVPVQNVEAQSMAATGTDDRCHQYCHLPERQSVQSDASGCESDVYLGTRFKNDKPRQETGLCDTMQDRASKRVRRFERPTFTLAT